MRCSDGLLSLESLTLRPIIGRLDPDSKQVAARAAEGGAMDTRLQYWAETGDYSEDLDEQPAHGRQFRGARPLEGAAVALMVPVGILVGGLLALAFVVRLLTLPLRRGGGSACERAP